MKTSRIRIAPLALMAMMAFACFAPAAMAQSVPGYTPLGDQVEDDVGGLESPDNGAGNEPAEIRDVAANGVAGEQASGEAPSAGQASAGQASGSALPFTGLDVTLIGIAGAMLLLFGVGIRRLTRSPEVS
jgi:hypothetical protein